MMQFMVFQISRKDMPTCEDCKIAKSQRVSYKPVGKTYSRSPLKLVHSDICGSLPVKLNGGARYFISFIGNYSKKIVISHLNKQVKFFNVSNDFKKRTKISKLQDYKS